MRRIGLSVLMVVAAALLAEPAAARSGGGAGLWIEGFGAWNTYSMKDPNRLVGLMNEGLAGSGLSMDEIHNGFGLGFRVGGDLPLLALGLGYERLSASSAVGGVPDSLHLPTLELKFPANAFYGLVEYRLPTSGALGVRLGVTGGYVSLAPVSHLLPLNVTGTGPLFEGYATGEWRTSPAIVLVGSVGYRHAKIAKPEYDQMGIVGCALDYSGVSLRAGLKFALIN